MWIFANTDNCLEMKRLSALLPFLLTSLLGLVVGGFSARGAEALAGGSEAAPKIVRQSLHFRFGKQAVDSLYRRNAAAIEGLDAAMQDASLPLNYVLVRVASSPDGPQAVNARLARERADNMVSWLRGRYPQLPDSLIRTVVVSEDWEGVERYLRRSGQPWKDEALAIVTGRGADREERLKDLWVGEAWDVLYKQNFPLLRKADVQLVFGGGQDTGAAPDVAADVSASEASGLEGKSRTGSLTLQAAVGKASFEAGLGDFVPDAASDEALFVVDAWASPEGRVSQNESLSRKRAEAARDLLVRAGVPAERILLRSHGEDWAGLRANVLADYDGSDREEILWILDDTSLGAEAKKAKLRQLSDGKTWRGLIASRMADLRRAEISVYDKAAREPAEAAGSSSGAEEAAPEAGKEPSDSLNTAL